jgi:hypothetical protein
VPKTGITLNNPANIKLPRIDPIKAQNAPLLLPPFAKLAAPKKNSRASPRVAKTPMVIKIPQPICRGEAKGKCMEKRKVMKRISQFPGSAITVKIALPESKRKSMRI